MDIGRMSEKEYNELKSNMEELEGGDCAVKAAALFSGLKKERKASSEFLHRWKTVAELLCAAECPARCTNKTCKWCYERDVELNALDSYKRSE